MILDGFDYIHLGKFTAPERQERYNQLMEEYEAQDSISIAVKGGLTMTKDGMNWGLLSRGSRAKQKAAKG